MIVSVYHLQSFEDVSPGFPQKIIDMRSNLIVVKLI